MLMVSLLQMMFKWIKLLFQIQEFRQKVQKFLVNFLVDEIMLF